MDFLLFAIALILLIFGLWLVRINRWPRVQVRVLKTWEEVTGSEEGFSTGWLHADIEYWYQSQKYNVHWKGDLMSHRFLPDAVWMVVDPDNFEHPLMPARWGMSLVLIFAAIIISCVALHGFLR